MTTKLTPAQRRELEYIKAGGGMLYWTRTNNPMKMRMLHLLAYNGLIVSTNTNVPDSEEYEITPFGELALVSSPAPKSASVALSPNWYVDPLWLDKQPAPETSAEAVTETVPLLSFTQTDLERVSASYEKIRLKRVLISVLQEEIANLHKQIIDIETKGGR
jgi:hypothetical protein